MIRGWRGLGKLQNPFFIPRYVLGVSPLISEVILVLIVASIMSAVYASFAFSLSTRVHATVAEIERIVQESAGLEVVDAFYISSNSTAVVCLYLREEVRVSVVRVYVDNVPVDPGNYVSGFNYPLIPEEINCIRFVVSLAPGVHHLTIVTDGGAVYEASIVA